MFIFSVLFQSAAEEYSPALFNKSISNSSVMKKKKKKRLAAFKQHTFLLDLAEYLVEAITYIGLF